MTCHEVAFAHALCRIEITKAPVGLTGPSSVAHAWVIDDGGAASLVVQDDGRPVEIHGADEATALSSATTYLAGRFGALAEYAHACYTAGEVVAEGNPVVVAEDEAVL